MCNNILTYATNILTYAKNIEKDTQTYAKHILTYTKNILTYIMMLGACIPCSHYSDWETFWHIVAMVLSRPETSFAMPKTTYVWCHFVCSGITSRSSGAALGSHRTAFCTGKNCSVTFRYCLYCLYSICFFLGFSQVFSNCPLHPLFTPNKEAPISVSIALACMVVPNSVSHHHISFHRSTPKSYPEWTQSVVCFDYIAVFEVCCIAKPLLRGGAHMSDILAAAKCIWAPPSTIQHWRIWKSQEIVIRLYSRLLVTGNSHQPLITSLIQSLYNST